MKYLVIMLIISTLSGCMYVRCDKCTFADTAGEQELIEQLVRNQDKKK